MAVLAMTETQIIFTRILTYLLIVFHFALNPHLQHGRLNLPKDINDEAHDNNFYLHRRLVYAFHQIPVESINVGVEILWRTYSS